MVRSFLSKKRNRNISYFARTAARGFAFTAQSAHRRRDFARDRFRRVPDKKEISMSTTSEDYQAKAAETLEQLAAATNEAERVRLRRAHGAYLKLATHGAEAAERAAMRPAALRRSSSETRIDFHPESLSWPRVAGRDIAVNLVLARCHVWSHRRP